MLLAFTQRGSTTRVCLYILHGHVVYHVTEGLALRLTTKEIALQVSTMMVDGSLCTIRVEALWPILFNLLLAFSLTSVMSVVSRLILPWYSNLVT